MQFARSFGHQQGRMGSKRSAVMRAITDRHAGGAGVGREHQVMRRVTDHQRVTMLRYGVDDLRLFFENDLRFLKQFN